MQTYSTGTITIANKRLIILNHTSFFCTFLFLITQYAIASPSRIETNIPAITKNLNFLVPISNPLSTVKTWYENHSTNKMRNIIHHTGAVKLF